MGKKLCPKIILKGTRLTFKTEIAFELNEHPRIVGPRRYRYHLRKKSPRFDYAHIVPMFFGSANITL